MHSSRMHTAHLLPVSSNMHCAGGCLLPGGVCTGVCTGGCLLQGGICSRGWGCLLLGVSVPRGCLLPGGCLLLGGSAPRGGLLLGGLLWGVSDPRGSVPEGCIPACTEADIPLVNRMTDRQIKWIMLAISWIQFEVLQHTKLNIGCEQ